MISKVTWSIGLDIGDRLMKNARKVKFVVDGPLPADNSFPERFRDFEVLHHYLQTPNKSMQSRLMKRGRKVRKPFLNSRDLLLKYKSTNITFKLTLFKFLG